MLQGFFFLTQIYTRTAFLLPPRHDKWQWMPFGASDWIAKKKRKKEVKKDRRRGYASRLTRFLVGWVHSTNVFTFCVNVFTRPTNWYFFLFIIAEIFISSITILQRTKIKTQNRRKNIFKSQPTKQGSKPTYVYVHVTDHRWKHTSAPHNWHGWSLKTSLDKEEADNCRNSSDACSRVTDQSTPDKRLFAPLRHGTERAAF